MNSHYAGIPSQRSQEAVAKELLSSLLLLPGPEEGQCQALAVCLEVKRVLARFGLEDAVNAELGRRGMDPRVSRHRCRDLFPQC